MDSHFRNVILSALFNPLDQFTEISQWIKETGLDDVISFTSHPSHDAEISNLHLNSLSILSQANELAKAGAGSEEKAAEDTKTHKHGLLNAFSNIRLGKKEKASPSFFMPARIGDEILYPLFTPPDSPPDIQSLWQDFEQDILEIKSHLSISAALMLLEKYFSFVPFQPGSETLISDISLYQHAKISGALAANIFNHLSETHGEYLENTDLNAAISDRVENKHLLIGGDISGVQDFIYTISSANALKSLRGRSFYLEMLTEKVVLDLIESLNVSFANLIYSGGGGFYLMAQNTESARDNIKGIRSHINKWLLDEFEGTLCFHIEFTEFCGNDLISGSRENSEYPFADVWYKLSQKIEDSKKRKFAGLLDQIFKTQLPQNLDESCAICHTDNKPITYDETKGISTCRSCYDFNRISGRLKKGETYRFVQTTKTPGTGKYDFKIADSFYTFSKTPQKGMFTYIINSWDAKDWVDRHGTQLLIGTYTSGCEELEELAKESRGKHFIAALRMDVDNLGRVFLEGLSDKSMPRMASLSRHLTLFFKYYINFVCEGRLGFDAYQIKSDGSGNKARPVDIIYSGGDDLFILGAWDQVAEIAFDIRRAFREYTGNNKSVTLSAGVTLHKPNYPVYQIAEMSKKGRAKPRTTVRSISEKRTASVCFIMNRGRQRTGFSMTG